LPPADGQARPGLVIDAFVTGTDPGVGKTHVCAELAARYLAAGRTPGYLQPVQTGQSEDARTVAERAPGTVCATVYRYVAPLAPAVAARLQHGTPPSVEQIVEAVEELRATTDGVLVEGPGGFLEPLSEDATTADLAVAAGLPLIVVARPEPASLSRVALTLEAARSRRLEVLGLVVNGCAGRPALAERTTRAELGRLAPVLASLPAAALPVS
jgi:dethiobiotin synthetase